MRAIGGYFELELNHGREYHSDAIGLNTARNAFEYVLRARQYSRVYLPYYTCDAMLEPIRKLGIEVVHYHVDTTLEPVDIPDACEPSTCFVYTNYFGLKSCAVETLARRYPSLIVDNSQAFFSAAIPGVDTIYSPRKFFGVPDGGYLYTDSRLDLTLEEDVSAGRFEHLLLRVDRGPEEGYASFRRNDNGLSMQPIKLMSKLTARLLGSIDYEEVASRRRLNFEVLHRYLGEHNRLRLSLGSDEVPMVYPFWQGLSGLRNELIARRVYAAQYWPNVLRSTNPGDVEYDLTSDMVPLPIDQRYGVDEMEAIAELVMTVTRELGSFDEQRAYPGLIGAKMTTRIEAKRDA